MRLCSVLLLLSLSMPGFADDKRLTNLDIFELEYANDPQISPDGSQIAYVRHSMDIMTDRVVRNIWLVSVDRKQHRPLLSGRTSFSNPRWSPSGDRLAYMTRDANGAAQLHVRWMDTGQTAVLTNVRTAPSAITWSPDGTQIAFINRVADKNQPLATPPAKPEGATWAPGARVIETLPYRADGRGYLETGYNHVFVLPAEGGTARQITDGDYNHNGPIAWTRDGAQLVFSASRIADAEHQPVESELWVSNLDTGEMTQLTDRNGPDGSPAVSPNGKSIAYLGFDDTKKSWEQSAVYVMDIASGDSRKVSDIDRSIQAVAWDRSSTRMLVQYEDRGRTHIGSLDMRGNLESLVDDVGGATLGRPYNSGAFSVASNGAFAYTAGLSQRPADVAVGRRGAKASSLTTLNEDLLGNRTLGSVEEISWKSSAGDYDIAGWLVTPPDFDPDKKYPFILEIHGGPHTAYGPNFSAEVQLYAAAGYVVLYANPRGSISYGRKFALEIHHNYPSQDYDDLMSGVDAVLERGFVDAENLFVTGGSGGGVLTAWIVGNTDRFRAAVVAKPVINWTSHVLTADSSHFFARYWFAKMPWEDPQGYWKFSPLSLVGNVTTPTALLTGEQDFRTPIGESEQYYQALKLQKVDTALIRIPEASHGIAGRPSHLIAKVDNILAWFARYRGD